MPSLEQCRHSLDPRLCNKLRDPCEVQWWQYVGSLKASACWSLHRWGVISPTLPAAGAACCSTATRGCISECPTLLALRCVCAWRLHNQRSRSKT